ncbi:MAG: hypothetical protein A3F72_15350 [Bacteroidetes bacterium RIFCSPLOWO2_12_FULL_35_15]|nr:MAG: hypothetical protein A3F72_15350 [Bacteroidetes bacterium RIFCSPLOWO2_12_FULL_35_15]
MTKKVTAPKTNSKKEFELRRKKMLEKCTQAGIFQTNLTEIENTKSDSELTELLRSNVDLRPFLEE